MLTEVKKNVKKKTAQKMREIIRNDLKDQPLSLMVDAVTRHRRSILGISIQYSVNGRLHIRSIGMIQLTKKHTGKYLADLIIKRLQQLEINLAQIITITTDNGANVLKMLRDIEEIMRMEVEKAKQPSVSNPNISIKINSSINSSLNVDDDAVIAEIVAKPFDSIDDDALGIIIGEVNNDTLLKAMSLELEKSGADFAFNITGVNCAEHGLQLAVKDGINQMPKFKNVIELCRIVCKEIRTDSCCHDMHALNIPYKKLRIENETRWRSMFLMVIIIN